MNWLVTSKGELFNLLNLLDIKVSDRYDGVCFYRKSNGHTYLKWQGKFHHYAGGHVEQL